MVDGAKGYHGDHTTQQISHSLLGVWQGSERAQETESGPQWRGLWAAGDDVTAGADLLKAG